MPEQGDIVLIPIPFTDLSSQKRRPVIVISHDAYHTATPDMVVVAMLNRIRKLLRALTAKQSSQEAG